VRTVTFNFRPDVSPARQDDVLERISTWRDVRKASRLKPGAKHPLLSRMAYAQVTDDADVDNLIGRLSKLAEIESASIPATRGLVKRPTDRKSRTT
jgi:hypothetical protein